MSRVTRQTGEIKAFQAEGIVNRGEEQRRVNGSQQRQGGRAVKGGKDIACGASENTKVCLWPIKNCKPMKVLSYLQNLKGCPERDGLDLLRSNNVLAPYKKVSLSIMRGCLGYSSITWETYLGQEMGRISNQFFTIKDPFYSSSQTPDFFKVSSRKSEIARKHFIQRWAQ